VHAEFSDKLKDSYQGELRNQYLVKVSMLLYSLLNSTCSNDISYITLCIPQENESFEDWKQNQLVQLEAAVNDINECLFSETGTLRFHDKHTNGCIEKGFDVRSNYIQQCNVKDIVENKPTKIGPLGRFNPLSKITRNLLELKQFDPNSTFHNSVVQYMQAMNDLNGTLEELNNFVFNTVVVSQASIKQNEQQYKQ